MHTKALTIAERAGGFEKGSGIEEKSEPVIIK